ncbi:hypothetical protein [Halegenticoccus tardaugens]|uniref:hypothetical protein n=1 Tax=Halegenticoccus tardaugens TaxID=2071624 RepID=UPI00100AD499|nr:hypothetical protein [Halegenticoccus tardaugens]
MTRNDTRHEASTRWNSRERERAGSRRGSERSERTRREYVKYGGAVAGGGLLAGRTGESDSADTSTETDTDADGVEQATLEDTSYEVCLSPSGCAEFDSMPESAAICDKQWADRDAWVEWLDDYYGADTPVDSDSNRFRRVREAGIDAPLSSCVSSEEIDANVELTERGPRIDPLRPRHNDESDGRRDHTEVNR